MYGKTIGNGYALTAVVGKKAVMEAAQTSFMAKMSPAAVSDNEPEASASTAVTAPSTTDIAAENNDKLTEEILDNFIKQVIL